MRAMLTRAAWLAADGPAGAARRSRSPGRRRGRSSRSGSMPIGICVRRWPTTISACASRMNCSGCGRRVSNVGPVWQEAESELGVRIATSQRAAVASQYRLASLMGERERREFAAADRSAALRRLLRPLRPGVRRPAVARSTAIERAAADAIRRTRRRGGGGHAGGRISRCDCVAAQAAAMAPARCGRWNCSRCGGGRSCRSPATTIAASPATRSWRRRGRLIPIG